MVYKGCEKRMIMIKNTGSELFEEAYFILNSKKARHTTEYDMIKEANRIVGEQVIPNPKPQRPTKLFHYLLGVLTGIGLTAMIMSFII